VSANFSQPGVSPTLTLATEPVPTEVNGKTPYWKQNQSLTDRKGYQVSSCLENCTAIQSAAAHRPGLPKGQISGYSGIGVDQKEV